MSTNRRLYANVFRRADQIAASRMRVAPSSLISYERDFGSEGDQGLASQIVAGSGTRNAQLGALRLSAGATAGSGWDLYSGPFNIPAVYFAKKVPGGAAVKWYMETYMKVGTAITAQTTMMVGATTIAAHQLRMGVRGAVSTTNFVLTAAAGATIDSGVAIDQVYHRHRAWRDAVNSYYQIDDGAPVVGTAQASTDCSPYAVVLNGTDAVDRFFDIGYWYYASALPS